MKASTVEKKKLKQKWDNKQHSTNRALAQNRVAKEVSSNRHLSDQHSARSNSSEGRGGGEVVRLSESDARVRQLLIPFSSVRAHQNRVIVSKRLIGMVHWRQEVLAFLSCRHKLGLSKDVARYICSWLIPKKEIIEFEENAIKRTDLLSGMVEIVPLPEDFKVSEYFETTFDVFDGDLWCFGDEKVYALDLLENQFREIQNRALADFRGMIRNHSPATFIWAGNQLFCLCHAKEWILEPNSATGTLERLPSPFVPSRLVHCDDQHDPFEIKTESVICGDMLFLLSISTCSMYPSLLDLETGCTCCGGSKYKRVSKPENCCVIFQVLYLSDLEHGWSSMLPPPVHYCCRRSSTPPKMQIDLEKKIFKIIGGFERPQVDSSAKEIIGGYSLNLANPDYHWKYERNLKAPPGVLLEHRRR